MVAGPVAWFVRSPVVIVGSGGAGGCRVEGLDLWGRWIVTPRERGERVEGEPLIRPWPSSSALEARCLGPVLNCAGCLIAGHSEAARVVWLRVLIWGRVWREDCPGGGIVRPGSLSGAPGRSFDWSRPSFRLSRLIDQHPDQPRWLVLAGRVGVTVLWVGLLVGSALSAVVTWLPVC